MTHPLKISFLAALLGSLGLVAGCASNYAKEEKQVAEMPVNCATAEGDIRMLKSEKATAMQQLAAGIATITPVGVIAGVATNTEGAKATMATGDYNKMIDQKISLIQQTCNVQ
jgi:hypothetical protein